MFSFKSTYITFKFPSLALHQTSFHLRGQSSKLFSDIFNVLIFG